MSPAVTSGDPGTGVSRRAQRSVGVGVFGPKRPAIPPDELNNSSAFQTDQATADLSESPVRGLTRGKGLEGFRMKPSHVTKQVVILEHRRSVS
jgi:hypothetical protein